MLYIKFNQITEVSVSDGSVYVEESLNLSENAVKVLEKRYLKRDKDGNCVEKPADMFRRVADTIAAGDLQIGRAHV